MLKISYLVLWKYPECSNLGWWSKSALRSIKAQIKKKVPIVVGGTGLYLRSLEKNISNVPKINEKDKARIEEIIF